MFKMQMKGSRARCRKLGLGVKSDRVVDAQRDEERVRSVLRTVEDRKGSRRSSRGRSLAISVPFIRTSHL